jgi:hypothetical protein
VSSAEELDEDRLRLDPLEAGMDPPERWIGVDKYGMTPYEQAHPRGLTDRLSEEEPDVLDTSRDLDAETEIRTPHAAWQPPRGVGRNHGRHRSSTSTARSWTPTTRGRIESRPHGHAEEVADVVVFLCSPRAVAITGDAVGAGGGNRGAVHY